MDGPGSIARSRRLACRRDAGTRRSRADAALDRVASAWLPRAPAQTPAGGPPTPSTSADAQGWTGRSVDMSAGTVPALRYARAASMQMCGAVVFLLAAGLGCWTAGRRMAAVFAALLAIFAAAAMILPGVCVPVAWGGVFGVVFCLVLRLGPS